VRISFLCPNLRISGGVRAILSYADRLAGRGHDVEVIVPVRRKLAAVWRTLRGDRPRWLADFRARVRFVDAWEAQALPRADVCVATAWPSARVVAAAPDRAGVKFYFVQGYESLFAGTPEEVDPTYRLPLRKIAISTWLRDLMREKFDSDAEVIVTPVEARLFHRVEADPGTSRPRALMLQHSHVRKGVGDGLEAAARVKRQVPSLHLVGFGVNTPAGHVAFDEFHPNLPQERMAWLYSGADIYLCPSWDEGLSMAPMEAMACGAALVTYDNGGCRDYARDGETALVARRCDVDELAMKLEWMATDAALRAKLAAQGQAFITTAFDWDRAVDRMEALFRAAR